MKIEVVDYDPKWKIWFARLSRIYNDNIGQSIVKIEHVGSTSVEGLCAKPCLDIDLVIKDYTEFKSVKKELMDLGYEYEGDYGIQGRESFRRKDKNVPWDGTNEIKHNHNLYVCPEGSRELRRHVAFREHLKDDDECREAYARLKRRLASQNRYDREAYTDGKTKFIERVLEEISNKNECGLKEKHR